MNVVYVKDLNDYLKICLFYKVYLSLGMYLLTSTF